MKAFLPLEINDAMLTSSTVVETPPAEFDALITYSENQTASVAGTGRLMTVYRSLQDFNTGHTPSSSPDWWVSIGTTYEVYSTGETYAALDRVIDTAEHLVYESLAAGNTNQPLTDTTKWAVVGYTNRWAMLKYLRSTKTNAPGPVTWVVTPGRPVNSMQFIGLQGKSISIIGVSDIYGGEVYNETITLKRRSIFRWWDWCFARFMYRRTAARFNIPPFRDIVLTITVTGDTGQDVTVGKWGIGMYVFLGTTEEGATPAQRSFSLTDSNDYGDAYFSKRRVVPKNRQVLHADPKYLAALMEFRAACDASPAFYYGADDETHVYADALAMLGSPIDFTPSLRTNEVVITLENQGL